MSVDLDTVRSLLDSLEGEQQRWLPGAALSEAGDMVRQARRTLTFIENTEPPSSLNYMAYMRWWEKKRNAESWLGYCVGVIEDRVLGMPKEYYLGISPDQSGEE